ncbi:MAG: flagellar biosynthesis protein [Ideonella sp.]
MNSPVQAQPVQDQADGLRRLFAHARVRFLPVVSNPHMAFGGVMLERICTALAGLGCHTLVVDAAERAPNPKEWAVLDLADCVESLSSDVSYLAARGLPLRFVDTHGSTASFLQAAADARPQADVVLFHAGASDLCRLFGQADRMRCARPLVLADEHPASVTHAYSCIKLLAQRGNHAVQDLLLCAASGSRRADRIGQQLARCADEFLGAVVRECLRIDPASHATEAPGAGLIDWARDVMQPVMQPLRPASHLIPHAEAAQQPWANAVARAYHATDAAMALN